ncbi:hypothetical protein [Agromyces albus]|uniref:Uncharacterized protein n=1 Tax=Agromyces albus TaxID=205332 RepID=A0A4V1QY45_9MICO|nr:hypothetical protein [Agromyces albus]RXZ71876.1 hypothetical protein ESP51_07030 [Agromyces albus]
MMRQSKPFPRGITKVTVIAACVTAVLSGCVSRLPLAAQPDAERWATDQAKQIQASYPELSELPAQMKRLSWCGYEELDEGVGTTVLTADIPIQVEEARALLRRIGDDYERAGWDVAGEGDYVPSAAALDNRALVPTDTEGHPEISLRYEASHSVLSLRVTSACYRTLEGEG